MKRYWIKRVPLFILLGAAAVFIFSGIVMLLWNGILPAVLHVGVITFWQAMGILLLAKILFGGFRGRRHHMGHHWAKHLHRKWQHMTPEERERVIAIMKEKRGCWHNHSDAAPAV